MSFAAATPGGSSIQDLGDIGVIHQGQRLPLRLEPGDYLLGVHAQLDDLEGHPPAHRFLLLGHPDDAEAAFADRFQELVAVDAVPGLFLTAVRHDGANLLAEKCRLFAQEVARLGPGMGGQEKVHLAT